ncbi:SDR family NAD(P)-dependent oxidoreductase [Actinophytocola algeriensis]|uniref:NAD(P)-dependent dehydrogenase (Short-subunit alcohol dehydrogenase family) n=1 Tax=Actinophytocola algeriensis TaxID=1768010 RepID=A0A7W7VHI3_9PSEU|nr:SDR family oxidoreductase [Actinophytocola algeriensis]MBB4910438.1 NAD(P)-dependent dehydrogenase (short-subunit alcohol dehydrogenase family) [Actinophytocola algeriensis]MBE1480573.1 NAD(P)-dependent dehydrogenase (short-subunit alcohol dehydrogenase family) [Actinophytocola algeriensis]
MRLTGRTALVTGSTSNIGRAIALAFGAEGAHVLVSGRDEERGDAVVAEIRAAGGKADFVAADLGSAQGARALATEATSVLGHVDILVNNAGLIDPARTEQVREEAFDAVFAVNVKAPVFLVAALAPAMAERGGGVIVNLGSWIARLGVPSGIAYSASKGAVETMTRTWAAEYGPRGVRVNAISPGVVHELGEDHPAAGMMAGTPAGTPGDPEAIARAAVYLASDDAAFVHGITLDVDGGRQHVAVLAGQN